MQRGKSGAFSIPELRRSEMTGWSVDRTATCDVTVIVTIVTSVWCSQRRGNTALAQEPASTSPTAPQKAVCGTIAQAVSHLLQQCDSSRGLASVLEHRKPPPLSVCFPPPTLHPHCISWNFLAWCHVFSPMT